jgi:NAD(P)-dependent dehydrogenase (short-subunit alcohol dehydrogenase family)
MLVLQMCEMGAVRNVPGILPIVQCLSAAGRLHGRCGLDPDSSQVALRRLGTVEDCAKVVEFLTTDLSDYVTGVLIPTDGGID